MVFYHCLFDIYLLEAAQDETEETATRFHLVQIVLQDINQPQTVNVNIRMPVLTRTLLEQFCS